MASKESKIVRKAQALSELSRLSALLAEQLKIEVSEARTTNRDAELAEIQRIESTNELLIKVLEAIIKPSSSKRPLKDGTVKS